MAGNKRTDSNGRILRNNELQRKQDGRYMYRYIGVDGKKKVVYASTLAELREKEKQIERDLSDGIDAGKANKITLNQQFYEYMSLKSDIRDSTRENYLMMWRNNVQNSFLGSMKISSIKPMHIEKLYAEFAKKGLSKSTIKFIHNLLNPCLQKAVDNDLIRKNPVSCVECTGSQKKKDALTADQQERLLDFVQKSNVYSVYYPFLIIALKTGCRIGELTGLTWNNIDYKENVIHVDHQLQYLKKDGKTQFCISPLKTDAGKRDIPITEEIRWAFDEQKKLCFLQGKTNQVTIDGYTGFVFITKTGKPYATNAVNFFLNNIIKTYNSFETSNAAKKNEQPELLPHISAHVLRHTACTRMTDANINIKVIQKIMGHSSAKVTMDVYAHANDTKKITEEMKKAEKIIRYR